MFLFITISILASNTSDTRTINVTTAGKLPTLLPQDERGYVVNLTLTGKLNGTDFNILRTMATDQKLQVLDLSGANIVSGGESYYSNYGTDYYTKNNEFGYALFNGCKKIQKIVLPNSLVTIGQCAFWYCTSLKTIVIGSKVTTIKPGLWGGCRQLTDVQINNNSNFHLANGILYNKDYTTIIAALLTWNYGNLTIRSGVKEIQYEAFSFCSNLTSVSFPSSVTTIGDTAFEYTGITSVNFTSSITSIGSFAFSGCKSLKQLDLTPLKVTSLAYGLFMTSNIEIVYLPKTLVEMKQTVFSGTPLKHIFAYTATPATMYDSTTSSPTFNGVDKESCVVHVPQGRVNTYKAAAGWKEFKYITDSQEIEASTDEAYAVYTTDGTLTFYYDKQKNSKSGTKYELNTGTNDPGWYTDHYKDIKKAVFHSSFAGARPTSTYNWFATYNNGESVLSDIVDIQYLNTSSATNMSRMFCYCNRLTCLDLSHFDTSNVINMKEMFWFCTDLTSLDLSNFNTNKVTNMAYMFGGCSSLTMLDLSNFNTSSVTKMAGMYEGCNKIKSLDLSQFDTSNVTDMSYMFEECSSLTNIDLCNFNTSRVTNMSQMFEHCWYLTTIYAGEDWNTGNVQQSGKMFDWCTNLVGGAGTKYDYNHVDIAYAHIDGGPSNPGYLTDKNKKDEVCDADDIQRFIDNAEGGTAEMTPCDEPTIDEDVEVDDIQAMIDGTGMNPQAVIGFYGGSINIRQNAGFSFKGVTFASKSANAVSLRANGNGGINNYGMLSFQNCTFQEGNYTIANSKDTYIDGLVTGLNLTNRHGGRIYVTSALTQNVNVSIEDASDIETDTPIILGSEGYTLSSADAAHIYLSLPTGYEWKYDSSTSSIIVTASTGVTQTTKELPTVVEAFDATGRRVNSNSKELTIQRMSDGTVKKHFLPN